MMVRCVRALVLAAVVMFGWSGVAAAAVPQTYNFSFTANGTLGTGTITTQTASSFVVTAAQIVFGGVTYNLDESQQSFGGSPMLAMKNAPQLFAVGSAANDVVLTKTPGVFGTYSLAFYNSNNADQLQYTGGTAGMPNSATLSNESFAPAAAPAPGAGLASWLIAALAAAGAYGWAWMRKRREAETALT